jgi:nucleotide-binding universal stress UspA family protein
MKTLVIPTDFSPLSAKALEFALLLAEQIDAGIIPVHSYSIPHTSETFSTSLVEMLRQNAEESMDAFVKNVPPSIPCQSKVTAFPLKEELRILAKDSDNIWVIMATHGEKDWWDHQLGTNASHIINALHVPIFLIPENAAIATPIRHILVATDGQPMSETVKTQWDNLKATFNATSQALQVVKSKEEEGTDTFEGMPLFKLYHENFEQGITEAEEIVQPELTVAIHHKRTWFESLFHSSATKELALRHPAPLVVLHE